MLKKERYYLGFISDVYISIIVYIVFQSIDYSVILIFFTLSLVYCLSLFLIK